MKAKQPACTRTLCAGVCATETVAAAAGGGAKVSSGFKMLQLSLLMSLHQLQTAGKAEGTSATCSSDRYSTVG